MKTILPNKFRLALIVCLMGSLVMVSCKKKKDEEVTPTTTETPAFRGTKIDYSLLTSTTPYNNQYFVNSAGDSTVDRTEGFMYLRSLLAIDAYGRQVNGTGTTTLYAATYENMFANVGSPFTGTYTYLNSVDQNVKSITGSSKSNPASIRSAFSAYYTTMANMSESGNISDSAYANNPGKLTRGSGTKILLDGRGLEMNQVISKSFMGAIQLDYICNVLLSSGLNADNTKEVTGKKYTELEHNWDVAYGLLTQKSYYGVNVVTTPTPTSGESLIGSYIWEYNRDEAAYMYTKIHPAFLKGRAAIVNNDMNEVRAQAAIIRSIMERTIAKAAVGYLVKANTGTNVADRLHALGEGLGFIYSLRFCDVNGADNTFSDNIIDGLDVFEGNGYWSSTTIEFSNKSTSASNSIKTKFNLQ